ncbi:MAG: hypothetical protein KAS04_03660 [Candidatus Aenigmarchaeota archaeon]|nr:hypothetical protein [Candidatus Aenigmarchaeota archaeon]
MADLFDTEWITEQYCKDIVLVEDITKELSWLDRKIVSAAGAKGVFEVNIPIDVDGYIESSTLIDYATYEIYIKLCEDFWGSAHGDEDIYKDKMEDFENKRNAAHGKLTKDNILSNVVDNKASIGFVPIY